MGSRGVHFETPVAMDLIMLASRLASWYSSARENQAYPIHPEVAHPPLPQKQQRSLPLRIPMVTLTGVQIQYQPPTHQPLSMRQQQQQQQQPDEDVVQQMRPSAPGPHV